MKTYLFITVFSISLIPGCGRNESIKKEKPNNKETLLMALSSETSPTSPPGACIFKLSVNLNENNEVSAVDMVQTLHRTAVSASDLKSSKNKTIKRLINPTKDSTDESIPEFLSDLGGLVISASAKGNPADCMGIGKNLAKQLHSRAEALKRLKADKAKSTLNFTSNYYCDYDCGITTPPMNNNYPYPYEFNYNSYGPTWAGGSGAADPIANSFFNTYYGGYNSGDYLYAGWSSAANGLKRAYNTAGTADTLAGGCNDGWGSMGGCIGGAVKGYGKDLLQGAAVNGFLTVIGAGGLTPVGAGIIKALEPTPAGGDMESICKTKYAPSNCRALGF